ncbi:TetR/AcrR family transcriptional regulator [Amycolatopsis sp. PS_44_ISF1]|uniref:TetR/AcrR family transcriptional regulator n=1 Tax=Amycolatopsis sp. PS_44_ISF1 TaxID=2974917 RepID=UPI0028E09792|nr:TetR/AcrR family transcriptional regulator [Amycolatopsis sp. PS_44_ISF1]MDT8915338.1 TetR/AcrR family transcriptional regulator [Amycolatopsis sp. PS_44_ISF1]
MNQRLRRERDRAEREQRIVTAARELAEAEGWAAVTTRRLAALIEYSQPVLYSHFAGKDAIMAAAVQEGCVEFAECVGQAGDSGVRGVAEAYVRFADEKPALYDAMFTLASSLPFGTEDSPPALRTAFAALLAVIEPVADGQDPATLTETFWAALHGLVTLDRGARLSPGHRAERLALLVARFGG